ncbi:MAG: adenylate/guanylate cyclase domain-containing protein [Candidatus Electryoneaceae bacterium]|nr:adenylate/guanylate cyclase domain-containing protein [Candidatus Electryoneaceae bacterium]
MPDNPSENSEVFAVIMYADIIGSTKLTAVLSPTDYVKVIRDYHQLSADVIGWYCQKKNIPNNRVFKRAYGDEILLLFYADQDDPNGIPNVLRHILHVALRLRTEWVESETHKHKSDIVDIRIGIGGGWVTVRRSVWDQMETPEGFALSEAKRIESSAGGYKLNMLIQGYLLQ